MTIVKITDCGYAMDGGSIHFSTLDHTGAPHSILLVQHGIPGNSRPGRRFGRLYMDGQLVAIRSPQESQLVDELCNAEIEDDDAEPTTSEISANRLVIGQDIQAYLDAVDEGPRAATLLLLREFVDWIRSSDYEALEDDDPVLD